MAPYTNHNQVSESNLVVHTSGVKRHSCHNKLAGNRHHLRRLPRCLCVCHHLTGVYVFLFCDPGNTVHSFSLVRSHRAEVALCRTRVIKAEHPRYSTRGNTHTVGHTHRRCRGLFSIPCCIAVSGVNTRRGNWRGLHDDCGRHLRHIQYCDLHHDGESAHAD